ncbi:MAG TPA: hypothetical protein VET51_13920 [Burkholderiales bacterium]|nr:hypothetical protein [Burkholderiales bacterium]
MRQNTAYKVRSNAAAYRHFSRPTYPTTREIVVTARRFGAQGRIVALMSILGFAAWFLLMWSL